MLKVLTLPFYVLFFVNSWSTDFEELARRSRDNQSECKSYSEKANTLVDDLLNKKIVVSQDVVSKLRELTLNYPGPNGYAHKVNKEVLSAWASGESIPGPQIMTTSRCNILAFKSVTDQLRDLSKISDNKKYFTGSEKYQKDLAARFFKLMSDPVTRLELSVYISILMDFQNTGIIKLSESQEIEVNSIQVLLDNEILVLRNELNEKSWFSKIIDVTISSKVGEGMGKELARIEPLRQRLNFVLGRIFNVTSI